MYTSSDILFISLLRRQTNAWCFWLDYVTLCNGVVRARAGSPMLSQNQHPAHLQVPRLKIPTCIHTCIYINAWLSTWIPRTARIYFAWIGATLVGRRVQYTKHCAGAFNCCKTAERNKIIDFQWGNRDTGMHGAIPNLEEEFQLRVFTLTGTMPFVACQ